jgi:hypothetical protein
LHGAGASAAFGSRGGGHRGGREREGRKQGAGSTERGVNHSPYSMLAASIIDEGVRVPALEHGRVAVQGMCPGSGQ